MDIRTPQDESPQSPIERSTAAMQVTGNHTKGQGAKRRAKSKAAPVLAGPMTVIAGGRADAPRDEEYGPRHLYLVGV